ncbi:dTDP-4-dehydrorhamnose reductase [Bacteroidota bacterium]
MKSILITGSEGQLGSELKLISRKYADLEYIFTDIEEMDISSSSSIESFIKQKKIDFIINCASYTAVDKAEEEPEKALMINAKAIEHLLKLARQNEAYLIHISTDYVFNGKNHRPYNENDATNPISVYGSTKLTGEKILYAYNQALIIRTSWLYSSFGKNFVKTILKYGSERSELKVVCDQIGTPTYAFDLAQTIMKIIESIVIKKINNPQGIYHYSNEGVCSWYDFALEIIASKKLSCKVIPVETKDYPTLAQRPFYSVLNKFKIKETFGISIPHWKESLLNCVAKL